GCGIAYLSNILGIGGGIITVPTLLHYKIPEKQAIATSAATGFVITLLGAFFYLDLGTRHLEIPYSIGYLYFPAFIVVGLISFVLAPYGARLAYIIPPAILRKVFGGVLFCTGILMLIS
ncbi:MAG: TSUP family transporter, partial [Chlamydiales bacterium]